MHSENDVYLISPPLLEVAPQTELAAIPLSRRLMRMNVSESAGKRWAFLFLALVMTAAIGFFLKSFWAPAPGRPGIDENGYLVGGKNFSEHGTPGFKPTDDYQFVGAMWVRTHEETITPPAWLPNPLYRWFTVKTEAGWYYPKYPAGLPLLNAAAIRLGGSRLVFAISPLSMCMAALGIFFLGREIAGSFAGLLAMICLAFNSTALELANDPGSHAPALCMVVWGMFFLIRWWQSGRWWIGAAAGLLLGYAVTIRYTEALLLFPLYPLDQILSDTKLSDLHPHCWQLIKVIRLLPVGPLGIAALLSVRWKKPASYLRAAIPILFWAIPVGALVTLNWFTMGHATGYDVTKESSGFTTGEFLRKWDFALHEMYLFGLFLLMPLGLAGLIMMYRSSWRTALLLTLWLVPGSLLYTAYYWGLNLQGVAFLRFFLTLFPPLILGALWLLRSAGIGARTNRQEGSIVASLTAGLFTFGAAAIGLMATLPTLEWQHRGNINLDYSAKRILAKMDARQDKIVFLDEGIFPQLLQDMQFMAHGNWYSSDAFKVRALGGFGIFGAMQLGQTDQNAPVALQHERIEYMANVMRGKTEADLVQQQHKVIDQAIEKHWPVYAILTKIQEADFRRLFITSDYQLIPLDHWTEPCALRFPGDYGPDGQVIPAQHSPLTVDFHPMEQVIQWKPQTLGMFEIRKSK
jgi:hypothetical protein